LRLLLDEQLAAVVAIALRERGHDVVAVQEQEHADWRGLDDASLFEVAQSSEGRAIVTDNVANFRVLARRALEAGTAHHGVLYLNDRSLPRHRHELFVSKVVDRLHEVLERYPDDSANSLESFV
jgi:predicted nuclease of predicted toxin-antitoxin system